MGTERYTVDVIRGALSGYCQARAAADTVSFLCADRPIGAGEELLSIALDLQRAAQSLSPRQREAVLYHLVLGEPEAVAARRLGISRQALRDRVRGALARMERALGGTP